MGLHWQELVIVLVIALVIFGPKRVPEIMGSIGRGVREFKDSVSGNGTTEGTATETKTLATATSAPVDAATTATPVAQADDKR